MALGLDLDGVRKPEMMNIHTLRTVGIVLTALLGYTLVVRAALLDGITAKVRVTPDAPSAAKGEKVFDDTLSFADGKFTSRVFLAKGFASAKYSGENEENEAEFEVEQTSSTDGVIDWLGEIRGSNVVGKLTWRKKSGGTFTYDFQGVKQ